MLLNQAAGTRWCSKVVSRKVTLQGKVTLFKHGISFKYTFTFKYRKTSLLI